MILCHCVGVSDKAIATVIEQGATTLADVTRRTGAGRCCAPCREEICAMLYSRIGASHTPSNQHLEATPPPA